MSRTRIAKAAPAFLISSLLYAGTVFGKDPDNRKKDTWKQYVGKAGPSGWWAHVIQPDPMTMGRMASTIMTGMAMGIWMYS